MSWLLHDRWNTLITALWTDVAQALHESRSTLITAYELMLLRPWTAGLLLNKSAILEVLTTLPPPPPPHHHWSRSTFCNGYSGQSHTQCRCVSVCGSLIVSIFEFDVCILTFTLVTFDIFILDKGFGQIHALSFFFRPYFNLNILYELVRICVFKNRKYGMRDNFDLTL